MDPYQQLVTQEAIAELGRQGELASNQIRAQQAGLGALGGERGALQLAELQRNVTEQQSRRVFEDMSRNFNQAQNAAHTAFENQQKRQQGVGQLLAGIGQASGQEALRTGAGIGQFGSLQANLAGQGLGLLGQANTASIPVRCFGADPGPTCNGRSACNRNATTLRAVPTSELHERRL